MSAKLCVACGDALPLMRRADRRYCGSVCQMRAHRIRSGAGKRQVRVKRGGAQPVDARDPITVTAAHTALDALQRQLDEERAQRQKQEALVAELREQLVRTEATSTAREDLHQKQVDVARDQLDHMKAEAEEARATMLREAQQARNQEQLAKIQIARLRSQLFNAQIVETRAKKDRDRAQQAGQALDSSLKDARKELARLRQKEQRRASFLRDRTELLSFQVCDLQNQLEDSEHLRAKSKQAHHREAVLNAQVQQLTRQLDESHDQNRKQMALMAHERSAADAVRPQAAETGFLSTVSTALLSGAVAGLGQHLGKRLVQAGIRHARRAQPVAGAPEIVKFVPDDRRVAAYPLCIKPGRLALPPKSEDEIAPLEWRMGTHGLVRP